MWKFLVKMKSNRNWFGRLVWGQMNEWRGQMKVGNSHKNTRHSYGKVSFSNTLRNMTKIYKQLYNLQLAIVYHSHALGKNNKTYWFPVSCMCCESTFRQNSCIIMTKYLQVILSKYKIPRIEKFILRVGHGDTFW